MDPSAAPRSLPLREAPTRALYATNEEGTTTDTSAPSRRPERRWGSHGGRRRSASGSQTDSSSAALVISASGKRKKKKKVGVTTKVAIPEFAGKVGHSDPATACRMWVCSITYYRNYYEDSYLMPLVVASVKNNAAGMFDFAKSLYPGDEAGEEDLGQILQKMREHYCGAFTFKEQHNSVENLKQGDSKDTADFLVRVTNTVDGLGKDWKGLLTRQELETLQYEVFLNGVNKDVQHVLDSEVVKHGQMTPKHMYMAVRCFNTYVARKDQLDGRGTVPAHPKGHVPAAPHYKPQLRKTTAFRVMAMESAPSPGEGSDPGSTGEEESDGSGEEGEGAGGLFLPNFLGEALDGDWWLHVRLAQAMQVEEKCLRCCFMSQSPDHLMHDCPTSKNGQRPLKPRGPLKNKSAQPVAKAKVKPKAKAPPPPGLPALQPAPTM